MNRQGPVEGGFKKKKAKSSLTECDRDAKEQVAHRRKSHARNQASSFEVFEDMEKEGPIASYPKTLPKPPEPKKMPPQGPCNDTVDIEYDLNSSWLT